MAAKNGSPNPHVPPQRPRVSLSANSNPRGDDLAIDFCRRLDNPWHLIPLFDYLPDTYFYAKDVLGRFVMVNQAQVKMVGLRTAAEMIGRTDHDFFPRDLADQYVAEDRRVMAEAHPLVNQAWLVPDAHGQLKWYLSSKIPLYGDGGQIIGIAGAMRDVKRASELLEPYRQMEEVLERVLAGYGERIELAGLARLVGLSVSQFDRRFKRLFQMTPQQFLLRVRLNAACRLLASGQVSIADIALRVGFYDQSYFTKHFKRQTGMTPTHYRRHYGLPAVSGVLESESQFIR